MFNKDKVAKAAQEIVDHLEMTKHIKSLQEAQKSISQAIAKLDTRIASIESDLKAIRAETALEAVKEAQNIVNNVQSNLNQRIENVAVKIAVMEATNPRFNQIDVQGNKLLGSKSPE